MDPAALTVKKDAPYNTVEEFIAYAKDHPGEISIGNSGPGSVWHIAAGLLAEKADIEVKYVPYDGAAPAITALVGDHIQAVSVSPAEVQGQVEAGDLKILGVMNSERVPAFPDVPTFEELGYDIKPENGQTEENCRTKVISFPCTAPQGKTKKDVSAIEQLENYKAFQKEYTDHNTSITVHVRNDEWEEVEEWLWNNWDEVVAVSFVSLDNSFYAQMPYEEITKKEYEKRVKEMLPFIPSLITKYEKEETEIDAGDESCSNGACPIR